MTQQPPAGGDAPGASATSGPAATATQSRPERSAQNQSPQNQSPQNQPPQHQSRQDQSRQDQSRQHQSGQDQAGRAARAARGRPTPTSPRMPRTATQAGPGPDTGVPGRAVRISSPASLLAAIPAILEFQPASSLVVIGLEHPRDRVRVTFRYDLPDPSDPARAAALVGHVVEVLRSQRVSAAAAVGYGPDDAVAPVAAALRERAAEAGITVFEMLRAEDGRYWSYVCTAPSCCPAEGTPFDVSDHPATRAFLAAGRKVLASRDELAATLATVGGERAAAMRRATRDAEEHVTQCAARLRDAGVRVSVRRLTAAAGLQIVRDAISRYRAGESIGTEYAAWLAVALRELRVRDDAWARMDPAHATAHLRLWTDLTRLARPGYVAGPAALLAFVAWQSGNGALGNIALDRALADSPRYSMALLLRDVLDSGAPPSMARLPMTPEEVAASYDAQRDGEDDESDTRVGGDRSGGGG